jgi:DNA polymerase-3 subunit gamma/tau
MAYQVLARKWRPQDFRSLIGQQPVVTALTNALAEGRIAQAYLFSGIRGVGKTTAARIFAKALNCERGSENGPCNECATCQEISNGADLDVLEIDAATYSKVEQVRELAESLKYGPARDRYKVVVLDEVHRLSRQAFDALLKIVEEPPPRLVFVFATTEIDSVPATILSRCQEYHFRRVPSADVVDQLAHICAEEKIEASERALRLIARAGEGSVRDSVALLDQLATFGGNRIDESEAARLMGGLDVALFGRLLEALLAGDAPAVAALAAQVESEGWDPRQVYAHFLAFARDALHLALGGDAAALDLPEEEAAALAGRAREAGYENLLRLLHQLLGSEMAVRRSDAGALALELAWLRAAELPKLTAIEEILAGARPAPRAAAAPAEPARRPAARAAAPDPPAPDDPDDPDDPAPADPPSPSQPVHARRARAASADAAGSEITRFHDELSARRPTLAAQLASAECEWRDGELSIRLRADDPLAATQLARARNRELLDGAVVAAFGAGARWRLLEPAAGPAPDGGPDDDARRQTDREERERAAEEPRVQAVLDIFGGSVGNVSTAPGAAPDDEPGDAVPDPMRERG